MQRLEIERLILRKFELTDAEEMFKDWATDSNVNKFLLWNLKLMMRDFVMKERNLMMMKDWISATNNL